jgi:hypothetical protein
MHIKNTHTNTQKETMKKLIIRSRLVGQSNLAIHSDKKVKKNEAKKNITHSSFFLLAFLVLEEWVGHSFHKIHSPKIFLVKNPKKNTTHYLVFFLAFFVGRIV